MGKRLFPSDGTSKHVSRATVLCTKVQRHSSLYFTSSEAKTERSVLPTRQRLLKTDTLPQTVSTHRGKPEVASKTCTSNFARSLCTLTLERLSQLGCCPGQFMQGSHPPPPTDPPATSREIDADPTARSKLRPPFVISCQRPRFLEKFRVGGGRPSEKQQMHPKLLLYYIFLFYFGCCFGPSPCSGRLAAEAGREKRLQRFVAALRSSEKRVKNKRTKCSVCKQQSHAPLSILIGMLGWLGCS